MSFAPERAGGNTFRPPSYPSSSQQEVGRARVSGASLDSSKKSSKAATPPPTPRPSISLRRASQEEVMANAGQRTAGRSSGFVVGLCKILCDVVGKTLAVAGFALGTVGAVAAMAVGTIIGAAAAGPVGAVAGFMAASTLTSLAGAGVARVGVLIMSLGNTSKADINDANQKIAAMAGWPLTFTLAAIKGAFSAL